MSEEKDEKGFPSNFFKLLSNLREIELEDVEITLGDLEISFEPSRAFQPSPIRPISKPLSAKLKPTELISAQFNPPVSSYPGEIIEVQLGNTKSDGGTRGSSIVIG